jgi:hypothetical protein
MPVRDRLSVLCPDVFQRLKSQAIQMHRDVMASGYQWDIPVDYARIASDGFGIRIREEEVTVNI